MGNKTPNHRVNELMQSRQETLIPYLAVEGAALGEKKTFRRTGNARYMESPPKNPWFIELNQYMRLADTLSMLVYSKRAIILKLFRRFHEFSNPEATDTLMAVMVNRALVERISYFYYISRQFRNFPLPDNFVDDYPTQISQEFFPKIWRALYQTSLEWREIHQKEFKSQNLPSYQRRTEDIIDRKPLNILTPISQLSKKVPGLENSYAFLSEFVHPNIGDLESVTVGGKFAKNEFGDPVIERTISSDCPDSGGGSGNLLNQSEEIILDALRFYNTLIPETDIYIKKSVTLCRDLVHAKLAEHGIKRMGFRKGSICPCMSGKRIKDCCTRYH